MLSHFTTSPEVVRRVPPCAGCPSRIRTSVHGSKVRCPTTRRRGSGRMKEEWSGRRDSNPRPSPWQGDALPTEPLPLGDPPTVRWCREPDSNWRHRDFQSRALPTELSRPDVQPAVGCPSAGGTIPRASRDGQRRPGHGRPLRWASGVRQRRRPRRRLSPTRSAGIRMAASRPMAANTASTMMARPYSRCPPAGRP